MSNYAKHVVTKKTSQTVKAKEGQIQGKGGGFVFKVKSWTNLNRFLILGNEKGSYYASEKEMTMINYDCVLTCLKEDWKMTIDTIVEISDSGRAAKNTPAIFSLAVCSVFGEEKARAYANTVMPKVARYSTDFFQWVDYVLTLKKNKKGKGFLRAAGRWYTSKSARDLSYQVCKYPSRSIGQKTISHADILRMCRIGNIAYGKDVARNGQALTIPSSDHATVFGYAVHGILSKKDEDEINSFATKNEYKHIHEYINDRNFDSLKNNNLNYIWAHEKCKNSESEKEIVSLISEYGLTRESISPEFRNNVKVQSALLESMPMTALIRNLGSMTSSGLLKPLSKEVKLVIDKITDENIIKKSRIHPVTLFLAQNVYNKGTGIRTSWRPVPSISSALEEAFYKSFNYVEPTGKNFLFGIDVSGSMGWASPSLGGITSAEAAAVMALTCAKTEKNYDIMGFADVFKDLKITAQDNLNSVIRKTSHMNFGATDCSLPMIYAKKNKMHVDVFVVLTDSETNFGKIHPFEALNDYREHCNPNAKMAVIAFAANDVSIADPSCNYMMDIAGFDSNVPKILSGFATDKI